MGISQCLLGDPVRYDGAHKRDAWLAEVWASHVVWVPVCPEVEAGMGVPREPVRLQDSSRGVRMVGVDSRADHTRAMRAFARRRVRELAGEDLDGYVFKARSPSCGVSAVPHFAGPSGVPGRMGPGLFAHAFTRRFPDLPVTEESALTRPAARAAFVLRVVVRRAWREFGAARFTPGRLRAFHQAHRDLAASVDPAAAAALDALVGTSVGGGARIRGEYGARLARLLAGPVPDPEDLLRSYLGFPLALDAGAPRP